jgi:hypothetical protein
MIDRMAEVDDVDIAGPVDDTKKMEVFTFLSTEGME